MSNNVGKTLYLRKLGKCSLACASEKNKKRLIKKRFAESEGIRVV